MKHEVSSRENSNKEKCLGVAFLMVLFFPRSVQSSLDSPGIGNQINAG
jgi:hypothetical protein